MTFHRALLAVPLLMACAHEAPPAAAPVDVGAEHALVRDATTCWMGGLWSHALGEPKGAVRERGISSRCNVVLEAVGTTDDRPLRVVDASMVARIGAKVHDPELRALLVEVADATRESMHARLVADEVKADAEIHPPPDSYTDDKKVAGDVIPLHQALSTLLDDHGPYAAEAHTIALLVALDRMEIAYRLPKRLKIAVAGPAYDELFGVVAPGIGTEFAEPLRRGIWLPYLAEVARASGHPVPTNMGSL